MDHLQGILKLDYFFLVLLLSGVVASAIAGALRATETKMDYTGAVFLAFLTANGGGTLRDLLLHQPIFWIENRLFLWMPCCIGLIVYLGYRASIRTLSDHRLRMFLLCADAMGLAMFTMIGLQKALVLGQSPEVAVFMAILSATGGGVASDVISNRPPLVFSGPYYIMVSLFGSVFYLVLHRGLGEDLAALVAVLFMISLRAVSIYRLK